MRLLVVDDDPTSRAMLRAVLEKHGHEVTEACDGDEAWQIMTRADAPRLVILDWMMPGLSGLELCQKVRAFETDRHAHIIMLTSLSARPNIAAGLDAGANDYVAKPFDPSELRARISAGEREIALRDKLSAQAEELRVALSQIRTLQAIIPICMHCRRVRDDGDYWHSVENYIVAHTHSNFSHGLCPECLCTHYPDYADKVLNRQ